MDFFKIYSALFITDTGGFVSMSKTLSKSQQAISTFGFLWWVLHNHHLSNSNLENNILKGVVKLIWHIIKMYKRNDKISSDRNNEK